MKILLVEDEQKLAQALVKGLGLEGYTVDTIPDGKKALTRISLHRSDYDLVILDLMLPSMDGLEICKQVREMNITVPILVLTARAETDNKVKLLLSGADDYLVKPFSFAELSARIRALMRRQTG
jgi:DNA-binding response OmpR family regulator